MSHPYTHAKSSAKLFGGVPEDYLAIHSWFDDSKAHHADARHRAMKHHSAGIFWAEDKFGVTIQNSDGDQVPVRVIGEQHVREDLGFIPSPSDWLNCMSPEKWQAHTNRELNRRLKEKPGNAVPTSLEETSHTRIL